MWHIFYTSLFTRTIQSKYKSYKLFLIDFLLSDYMQLLTLLCLAMWSKTCVMSHGTDVQILFFSFITNFLPIFFHPNSIFSRCFQLFYLGWQYFIQPGGINTRLLLYSLLGPWDQSRHNFKLVPQIDPSVPWPVFTITEKAPTRAFSWLKAPTGAFTFKTLLRHRCWPHGKSMWNWVADAKVIRDGHGQVS